MSGPYADAALLYLTAGWSGVLPLPARRKWPPPDGYTGHRGAWTSGADVHAWRDGPEGAGNVGLRVPQSVIGIDVDNYAGKQGGATIEAAVARWGKLPPTWRSTNREDGQGSILFFRVPEGLAWPGIVGPDVEIIQFAHRYAVVWPSVHPEGRQYRWIGPDGAATYPRPDQLPDLPDAWVAGLTQGEVAGAVPHAGLGAEEVEAWLSKYGDGFPCMEQARVLGEYPAERFAEAGRHDLAKDASFRIVSLAREGHPGATSALREVERRFTEELARHPRSGPLDRHEWGRLVNGAVQRIAARAVIDRDPCIPPSAQYQAEGDRPPRPTAPPRLDSVAFHGILGEIVAALRGSTEADPAGILGSLLCGTGVLMSATPHLQIGASKHPLLVWPLLFGRTGSGRKGEATNAAELFLKPAHGDFARLRTTGLSSGEGLIEAIRDPAEVKQGKKTESVGTNDKRLFVVEPEFSSVMARAKREGNTLAAVLRQAWDGRALSVLNRSALRASSSHIGIVGHVTPREFRMRLAEAEMAGGLYNRFCPLWTERAGLLAIPPQLARDALAELSTRLGKGIANGPKQGTTPITLDEAAARLWTGELYPAFAGADDTDEAWAEFSRRAAPNCLRIAGIHTVLAGRQEISKADLEAAAAVIDFAMATARYVLGQQSRDPRLDRVRRAIDDSADGLTRTEIRDLLGRHLLAAALNELLASLVADGQYEEVEEPPTGGVGRPRTVYRRATKAREAR